MSAKDIQPAGPRSRYQWEHGETLVDRRNRLRARVWRAIKAKWFLKLLLIFVFIALTNAGLMRAIIAVAEPVLTVAAFILIFLSQFILLFWFLSRTRTYEIMPGDGSQGISFNDYRGQPEILEQAEQIVTLLRGVRAFEGAGGEPLNGLLLEGPPGTGKTWLAQAISTEANVPFFYMDASSLQAMFMGVGPMKVMRLYGKARKKAKQYGAAVIFLDEIDAVGSRGGVASVGGDDENDGMFGGGGSGGMGVLSTLLIELSGFSLEHGWRARWRTWWYKTFLRRKPPKPERRVLTIGATNRMQALDAALLRSGRFDKKIRVDVPDMEGRREIFDYYLEKYAHDDTINSAILATETPGYSPADIKYLLNEALRYAYFDGRDAITYRDFMLAQPEHERGLRSPLKHIAPEAKRRLAFYFAGRATAVRLLLPDHRIARVTIVRQGLKFGHLAHYPAREAYQGMLTKAQLLDRLRVIAAGRAAEIEFCGVENQTFTYGDDFNRVLRVLQAMAAAGMFNTMGASMGYAYNIFSGISYRFTPEQSKAVEEIYQQILRETRMELRKHKEMVEALVELLIEKEELLADEVRQFFDQYGLHTPDPTLIRDGVEFSIFGDKEPAPQLEGGPQVVADDAPVNGGD